MTPGYNYADDDLGKIPGRKPIMQMISMMKKSLCFW